MNHETGKSHDVFLTTRCRAFSGDRGPREHQVCVDPTGNVTVYDEVAGHYTSCHSLSPRAQARIRGLVR